MEGKMEVEIIKANPVIPGDACVDRSSRKRVAAYCRVSTDDEDQIKSYNSMVRYYTDLIKSNKEWDMAGVYADKAITGTKVDKRENFQRLIDDCLDGKIDMVIAKSIPRFARNTLDTLKYVRMLKERNIDVYFEVEKIHSLKDGEFLLTILSSVAQQEVENTSAYVRKGLKMKMERGEMVGFQGCLGYDYDPVTKTLSINEEGAEDVKYIFDRYIAGAGGCMIARELNEMGKRTIKGNKWTVSSVMGIVKNEKYKGDLLMGKTYTVDAISKRRLQNMGQEDKYYIKNHHPAIVSEDIFDKAQEIRNKRNGNRCKPSVESGSRIKYSRQYAFSSLIECGYCGKIVSRRSWHSNTNHTKTIWQCSNSTKNGKQNCPESKGVPEEVLEKAFLESYRMLCDNNNDVIDEFIKRVDKALSEDSVESKLVKAKNTDTNLRSKRSILLEKYLDGSVAQDIYETKDLELVRKLAANDAAIESLKNSVNIEKVHRIRLKEFRKVLEENRYLEKFDRSVFESLIEKVILGGYDEDGNSDPYKVTFIYRTGYKDDLYGCKTRYSNTSTNKKCSNSSDEVKAVCSNCSDDTCGDGMFAESGEITIW